MRSGIMAASVSLLVIAAPAAQAKWLRADTPNFIIYSEGSEQSLRSFAENVERLDTTLRTRFNLHKEPAENRLTIVILPRAVDVARMRTGKSDDGAAGFYSTHAEGTFAVSNREPDAGLGSLNGTTVLFHEYAHHFMLRYAPHAYPAWFIEGFAEYHSTVEFTKEGNAKIGIPAYHRAYGLLEMPKMPVARLLQSRPGDLKNSDEVQIFYSRAWLLTHMLYSGNDRAGQLSKYVGAINAGTDPEQAASTAFGDLAQLDKDLNRYLSGRLSYISTRHSMSVAGDIVISALSPADDAVMPLRLERLGAEGEPDRLVKLRAAHAKLAAKLGDDAGLWYERAALEWNLPKDQRDPAMLKSALERALALNPDHVHANVLTGLMLGDELDAKGDYSAAAWRAARKPITHANRLAPNDPWPLFSWYNSFRQQGIDPPDIAHQGLARAFALAPENLDVRINYAFDLARKRQFDPAIKLAKTVAFNPHSGGEGRQLVTQLEALRDSRAASDAESGKTADGD